MGDHGGYYVGDIRVSIFGHAVWDSIIQRRLPHSGGLVVVVVAGIPLELFEQ